MMKMTAGMLLRPREATICWKERTFSDDLNVDEDDLLLLCSTESFQPIPGFHMVHVIHPRYGTVSCLLDELVPVKNQSTV